MQTTEYLQRRDCPSRSSTCRALSALAVYQVRSWVENLTANGRKFAIVRGINGFRAENCGSVAVLKRQLDAKIALYCASDGITAQHL